MEILIDEQKRDGYSVEIVSRDEKALLDNYRSSPEFARDTLKTVSDAFAKRKGVT